MVIKQWIPLHVRVLDNKETHKLANDVISEGVNVICKPLATELVPLSS